MRGGLVTCTQRMLRDKRKRREEIRGGWKGGEAAGVGKVEVEVEVETSTLHNRDHTKLEQPWIQEPDSA